MTNDYMAFFVYNGKQIISFVQVGKQFFGNYGTSVMVSPANRITSIEHNLNNNYAKLQFYGLEGKGGTLELDLRYGKKMKEFVRRFVESSEKGGGFLSRLFGFTMKVSRPIIVKIDMSCLLKKARKLTGKGSVGEIDLPNNLTLRLNEKKKEYTTLGGRATPINYYTPTDVKDEKGKNLKEVLVETAWRLEGV